MEGQHAMGIDVGGSKVAGAIVDLSDGSLTETTVIRTGAQRGADAVLVDVVNIAGDLGRTAGRKGLGLSGAGICVPELVDLDGNVTSAQTLDWRGIDIGSQIRFNGRVVIESDARAGAMAEERFGVGGGYDSFVFVAVGTGVGSTFVLEGRPWKGANGNAIVAATGAIPLTCKHCGRHQDVVLERVASGAAIEAAYAAAAEGRRCSASDVIARAATGDDIAWRIVDAAAGALAGIVGYLVNVLDPHAVVVGGGLGSAATVYWDRFLDRVPHHIFGEQSRTTPIIRSSLGRNGPLVGAALAGAGP